MDGRHRWAAGALALALLAPAPFAIADDAAFESYNAILDLFTAGTDGAAYQDGSYLSLIAPSIRGTWAPLRTRDRVPDTAALDDYILRQCEIGPIIVNPMAPFSIVMERTAARGERSLVVDYLYLGGATFSPRVDPTEMVAFYGFDRPGLEQMVITVLADSQTDTSVYVVNDDMLVLVRPTELEFFLRCPGDDRLGNRELAIQDMLWRAAEGATLLLDADSRHDYFDCGLKVLDPASRETVAELIRVGDLGQEAAELFSEGHPDIVDGLTDCIDAAEANP